MIVSTTWSCSLYGLKRTLVSVAGSLLGVLLVRLWRESWTVLFRPLPTLLARLDWVAAFNGELHILELL